MILVAQLAVTIITSNESNALLQKNANERLKNNAGKMDAFITQWEENAWATLNAIYELPDVQSAARNGTDRYVSPQLAQLFNTNKEMGGDWLYPNMLFLNTDGTFALGAHPDADGLNVMNIPPYIPNYEQAKQGTAWVSQVAESPVIKDLMEVWFSRPIMGEKGFMGMAVLPCQISGITHYMKTGDVDDNVWYVFVTDQSGTIAASTKDNLVNTNASDLNLPSGLRDGALFEYTSPDKVRVVGYKITHPTLGWEIYSMVDKSDMMQSNYLVVAILASLVAIVIASFIIYVITSRNLAPIQTVTALAKRIADGDTNI